MPIKHVLWAVGVEPRRLAESELQREDVLETMILRDSRILSDDWMLIGHQVPTNHGPIDILGIAPDGALVVIELKRDRTPRDVVAQALDYAGCIEAFTSEKIAEVFRAFSGGKNLMAEFKGRFGHDIDDESLNSNHQIVIVAARLDVRTESIVRYLNDRDVPINVVFFQVFADGEQQFLSRTWLIDPTETQLHSVSAPKEADEPWNGEFYVSFGHGQERSWDEARRFGFISAGGGAWYTRTLNLLKPGDRIWVNVPSTGYVGVGSVLGPATMANEFRVEASGELVPAIETLKGGSYHALFRNDPEKSEYFVPVKWLDTVGLAEAYSETGLFGNQNTVCKPTAVKWRHTVERLKGRFQRWNEDAGLLREPVSADMPGKLVMR